MESLIDKLNKAHISQLPYLINILCEKEENKNQLIDNIEIFLGKMEWFVVRELLQIEGIDKEKILSLWLKNIEMTFGSTKELSVQYMPDDRVGINLREEMVNNADQITEIANRFLTFDEIPEDTKIILRNVILRNFSNIISNSYYTLETLDNLYAMGLPKEAVLSQRHEIINSINGKAVPTFYKICQENNQELDVSTEQLIDLMLKDNKRIYWKENGEEYSDKEKNDLERAHLTIKSAILGLMRRQQIDDFSQIEYLSSGYFSDAFKVGDFVVKIGSPKDNTGIPYSKHIIDSVVSIDIKMGLTMEIQSIVDAKWYDGLSEEKIEEQLFLLYFKLRKGRVVWKDIKKENAGRLLKSNKSNLMTDYHKKDGTVEWEEMNLPDWMKDVVGREDDENEILPAGETVVIDRDFLVGRGAWTTRNPTKSIGEQFAKEYEKPDKFRDVLIEYLGEEEFKKMYPDKRGSEGIDR